MFLLIFSPSFIYWDIIDTYSCISLGYITRGLMHLYIENDFQIFLCIPSLSISILISIYIVFFLNKNEMVLHLLNILIVDIFLYQQVKIYSFFCLLSSTPLELDHNLNFSLSVKIHAAFLYFKECCHGHFISCA